MRVNGAPPKTPGRAAAPSLWTTLRNDVLVIVDDVRTRGISRIVSDTFASIEAFYLTDDERRHLAEQSSIGRFFLRLWFFLKGLLLRLTPARRVMLAVALWFLIFGVQRIRLRTGGIDIRYPFTGTVLLFLVLVLELKDKLVARDELEAGRKVQLALMPSETPVIPGWDVWLYTQPANDVGGDLVDHLPLDAGMHSVALGDVAGKALPAALLSVKLQATLRALAPLFPSLGDLGAAVNRILHRDGLPTRFASLVYLILPPDSGHVRMLNAGHMPPLLVRGSVVTPLERGGMVLGIMPGATFVEQAISVEPGDILIVYSDGVSEAMNERGDFFGDDRLHAVAVPVDGLSSKAIGRRILERVQGFIGQAPPSDDISLMVLRRTASEPGSPVNS